MRVDPLLHLGLPTQINALNNRVATLTAQLSSGLRVSTASDDPLAASQSIRLGSSAAAADAYTQASNGVQSRLQVADSALGTLVSQLTSAISLAVKGLNGTLDTANIQAIGEQIGGLRDEVLTLANSSYAGSYLFSGTATGTQPYSLDTSTTPAAASYAGDAGHTSLVTPGGQMLTTSVPGTAIFSASGGDLFGSLNRLVADFASGAPSATSAADLVELRQGLANVTAQRGLLGASLNTLEQTTTYAATDSANLKAAQSTLVAANTAEIATDLSTVEEQQKALLSVMSSSASRQSLFDFLQ